MEPTPQLHFFHYFMIAVILQGVFLAWVLFSQKKGDKVANRILSALIVLMTYFSFVFFLNDSGYKMQIGTLFLSGYSIVPLIPLVLYLYLKRVAEQRPPENLWIHFIPFLVQFVYWLPNNTNGFLGWIPVETYKPWYSLFVIRIGSFFHMTLFVCYAYAALFQIDYRKVRDKRKTWIRNVKGVYVAIACIFIAGTLTLWAADWNMVRYIFFSFLALFIYMIGYYGFVNSDVVFEEEVKPKYYSSGIDTHESVFIFRRLQTLMGEEKPYLKPSVKLVDLANRLEISSHDLSRSINENFEGSFHDFINSYRVEAAKLILSEPTPPKMLAVALDSGFGNKVSFYKHFKKQTGSLPSEFGRLSIR